MEVWNSIAKEAKGEIDRIIPIIGNHWSINLWTETNRTSEDAISTQSITVVMDLLGANTI